MEKEQRSINKLFDSLKERAKELNCLFRIEELLKDYDQDIKNVFRDVLEAIPPGWQYSDHCQAKIIYLGKTFQPENYVESTAKLSAYLATQNVEVGTIEVSYTKEFPVEHSGPFLAEEETLLITIANRLGDFIQHQGLQRVIDEIQIVRAKSKSDAAQEWKMAINITKRTDGELYIRITRKLINYLCWNGIEEANEILQKIGSVRSSVIDVLQNGENQPHARNIGMDISTYASEVYEIADRNLSDEVILSCIQKWMAEDRTSFLVKTLVNINSTLADVGDAIRRFKYLSAGGITMSDYTMKGARVSLIRKIITEGLEYINIAKNYVEIDDFNDLLKRMIFPIGSHGQIGGKSAGLFLAWQIIKSVLHEHPELENIRIPKTWYLTSDGLHSFMDYNDLEEVTEQKYKDLGLVRQEYPHIIQLFINSQFTPEIIKGLSMALDDFEEKPIIVRSSSLLEDSFGSAFSGKYKSLFLANQGTKEDRLQALMDAIAEVYSSTFGSDPIEYRIERGLIDFKEAMGVIIQEVVGQNVGRYFFPSFAGVAFSQNEFRWSPRIKRDDGLIRMVPGLGTRAVDRLAEDFPILISPGQPGLRANVTKTEILKYSPRYMDVINIETNSFETVKVSDMLKECGDEYPVGLQIVSVIRDGEISQPSFMNTDFANDEFIVTFEGLFSKSPFIKEIGSILNILKEKMGTSVDIEFASDGKNIYLLQCRPQGTSPDSEPVKIPTNIPEDEIIFTAHRFISNGKIPDITHIVYVDPNEYSNITDLNLLLMVGRAVGRLNELLPSHSFILMGPGRWGSRGDIKLGVNVTYSDINNTAVLIEIARQKGNYVPDLSFGTHFFQDLTEAGIRYIPLYPDEEESIFNDDFLLNSENILNEIIPEYAELEKVIHVIDVKKSTNGKVLQIFMNADLVKAVGVLMVPVL